LTTEPLETKTRWFSLDDVKGLADFLWMRLWGERFSRCYSIGLAAGAGFALVTSLDCRRTGA